VKKRTINGLTGIVKLVLLVVVGPAYVKNHDTIFGIYDFIRDNYFDYLDYTVNEWTTLLETNELSRTKLVYIMADYIQANQYKY